MLDLPGVTLLCVDSANHALALRALERSRAGIRFARSVLLTDALPPGIAAPADVAVVPIPALASREAYSQVVLKGLLPHVATPHVLIVQWDGYVINPAAWDPAFADCDYIGAKWQWHNDGMRVGNGGFSLRSRRLLEALQDPRIELAGVEDETICRAFRPLLEREFGIRYADESLADRFSFEAAYPIGKPFGFHGLFNFCRVMPAEDIAAVAPLFSDSVARSLQLKALLRNCVALGQWVAVGALAQRMLAASPGDADARGALALVAANAARGPVAGRNEPCPCGSGKRYKHCHGAPGAAPLVAGPEAPPSPDALFARALEAHQRGNLDAAEHDYRAALEAAPQHPHALHYLGVVLYQRTWLSEALPLLQRSTELIPHEPEFHNNLGLALMAADRTDDAVAAYGRALALDPAHAVAWNNLGLAQQAANRLPDAIAAYRQALRVKPDFAHARWNLGIALLTCGEFAEGWRDYEQRLHLPELRKDRPVPPGPRWDGRDARDKTILLTSEQGLGDALQFVRFASTLAQRGARVLVQAQPALLNLLASAPGVAGVCSNQAALPAYDAHLPLLSVAGALGVTATTIPNAVPYLRADPAFAPEIAAALAPADGKLHVGLAWAGSRAHVNDRRRSIPLAELARLFDVAGVAWYSLQKDDGEAQIPAVPAARRLILPDARRDFDRKAALIEALDLVVSVDTSIAHLAGALARPLWVLLPFAPDWRWQLGRSDSPWYPTARLFRQPRAGDWGTVIDEVSRALAARIADRK